MQTSELGQLFKNHRKFKAFKMKPLLARDWNESKLAFPVGVQPKIDGVRGLTTEGGLTGRSLKQHKNLYTTEFYSGEEYAWLDGELAAADEKDPKLCRTTSSALSTIVGKPFTFFHVFDYLHKHIIGAPYKDRYEYLLGHIASQQKRGLCLHAKVVPMYIARSTTELLEWEDKWLAEGYEGLIIRNLDAPHKQGRSGSIKAELWRIKRFLEEEAIVESLEEGFDNNNEAQTNELGRTFRTSHMDNKVPNGTVGNMQCRMLKDVIADGKLLLTKDQLVTVAPGSMTHLERKRLWDYPTEIVGKTIKFKFFPKGIKDKPRFPTFQSIRSEEDMG